LARAKPLASEPVEAALRVEVDELEVLFLV
jgi:hypothetical protein